MTGNNSAGSSTAASSATENANAGVGGAGQTVDLPTVKAALPDASGGDSPCDICRSSGLVILPARYVAVPRSCPGVGVSPLSRGRGCAEDISAAGYDYALRTLRQGMLYVYYEQAGPYGARQWEAYAVAENGTLWRQPTAHAARRIDGGGLPACTRSSHNALRMEFITIQRPHLCQNVWIAFSEHTWTSATLDRYGDDATLRAERMQKITPANWIKNPQTSEYAAPLDAADKLKAVLEYRGFGGAGDEPAQLPHNQRPAPISKPDGSHFGEVLERNATRYPWALRTHAGDGVSGDEALEQRLSLMQSFSHDGQSGEKRKSYAPMLLGLWDAVGVAHELNGFRHDVVGAMARYKEERAMQFNAMEHIEEIDTLLQRNAGVLSDQYAQASRARLQEMEEDLKQSSSNPIVKAGMEEMRNAGLSSSNDETWDNLSKALLPLYQREARDKWLNKYWPLIDKDAYELFKSNSQKFAEEAMALLGARSQVVGKLLANELFLATLEDYDGTSPECGLRFEETITTAIESLGMDAEGRQLLEGLSGNLNVTGRSCLLWRVVAQNQTEVREELEQALSEADSLKDTVLTTTGAAWASFIKATDGLKKFYKAYKGFEALQTKVSPLTANDRMLRETGVDRFVVSAGAFMLNHFPLSGIQEKAGNSIVKFVFMTRALMDSTEATDLIHKEASTASDVRAYFIDRIRHHRGQRLTEGSPLMYALRDVERHQGTELMRRRWQSASESNRNAVRLSSLTGILELLNFVNLLLKADKQARDYGSLVASGAALVSVYASVSEKVGSEFYGSTSRSMGRMKAIGGWAGGFATTVSVYYEMGIFFASAKNNNMSMMVLSGLKVVVGAMVAASQFLTALIFSAPIIEKATGKRGLILWLDSAKAGLQAAAAKEGAEVLAKASMKRMGIWILRLGGWEVTVVLVALDVVIYLVDSDALEKWCQSNVFGRVYKGAWLGFGATSPHYEGLSEQNERFMDAIADVSAKVR